VKIAFIGLGNMGAPMARCLSAAGYDITGFDTAAAPNGLSLAGSAQEASRGADVVITMLPNGDILRKVADDIYPVMPTGAIHLDCSTVDVQSARDTAQAAETAGLYAIDAPVSGGTVGAAGQAAKICNNMILGATMVATCEAFALADKLGLDRQSMFDVVSLCSKICGWHKRLRQPSTQRRQWAIARFRSMPILSNFTAWAAWIFPPCSPTLKAHRATNYSAATFLSASIGLRYCPVWDASISAICSGVPVPTTMPPLSPPSGPISIT